MMENMFENIQRHLTMLDHALDSSEKIRNFASGNDLNGVISETENRERLVNIVSQIQSAVEGQINKLENEHLTEANITILKAWFHDLSVWSEKMLALDRETVEILGQQKEETTKEIAHVFKNKELFKGYSSTAKK